jgi:hypothetical protein
MSSLLKTEWFKMRKYPAFWWIMGLTLLSYPGINYLFYQVISREIVQDPKYGQFAKMAIGSPYEFPETWHTVMYFSSWFIFIPAVVVIMLICNEYSFKTHRQNIIDGWGRGEFISSKLIDVLIISAIITAVNFVIAFIFGTISQERLIKDTWGQVQYVLLFGLQTFAQLTIAFLIGFLVRKAFIALGIFIFYYLAFENILTLFLQHKFNASWTEYFPLNISDGLVPPPAFISKFNLSYYNEAIAGIPKHIALTIALTSFIWGLCYWINKRRDLK